LVRPQEITKTSYGQLVDLLKKIYAKPINTATERYTFHKLVQQTGQSMQHYIEQLRQQALKCKFGNFEDEACKDQLVLGVGSGHIVKKTITAGGRANL